MIEFEAEARRRLDEYLGRVRSTLRGCHSVDPAEVERDIMDHIQSELAGAAQPVPAGTLEAVLAKLGSPAQWVPEEDRAWWWRALSRLREGPEDFRLAYLTFGTFVVGLLFFRRPVVPVFLLASFLLARAAVAFRESQRESHPQRWLIYPPLVVVYLLLLGAMLGWPIAVLVAAHDEILRQTGPSVWDMAVRKEYTAAAAIAYLTGAAALSGGWLIILGAVARRWPGLWERVFAPFVSTALAKRIGKWLIVLGLVAIVILMGLCWAVDNLIS